MLAVFFSKMSLDCATYRHLMGQTKKTCTIPHHNFPSHNLVSLETVLEFSKNVDEDSETVNKFLNEFPCYTPFDRVTQLSSCFYCGNGLEDFATDLVVMKQKWEKRLKSIRVRNLERAVSYIRNFKINKPNSLPNSLVQYIEHFHNDPEPEFSGNYNWLYTGGNLTALNLNDGVVLISADYLSNFAGFNILKLNDTLDKLEYNWVCQLKKNSPVLQISCKSKESEGVVCIRQKNNSSLFKINSSDDTLNFPKKLWRKRVKGSKLLTCVDINNNCKEVIIADSKSEVHVYDIETRAKTFFYVGKSPKARDAWNQVVFCDNDIYMTNRDFFCLLDVRVHDKKPEIVYDPSSVTNSCEDICSLVKSSLDSNYLYLGTTHTLIQIDVRNGKAVQRWTHLMKDSPQFASCVQDGNRDFVVLQSKKIDETLGITNDYVKIGENVDFLSKSLPYALKSIKESLRLARLNGLCLNPFIPKRLDFAVTGILCLKNSKDEICLFTENSGGDVFLTKIRKKDPEETEEDETKLEILNSMKSYENNLKNYLPPDAHPLPNKTISMKHVLKGVRDSDLKMKPYKKPELHWKYHEKYAPESLKFYRDILAQKILKVWGVESEEIDSDEVLSPSAKVQEWIEKL